MALNDEQAKQIKESLLSQVDKNFPEDKKEAAKTQINEMSNEELEEFLKQNNLLQTNGGENKCIFCSIVFGDIPSTKIDENEKAVAVFEINPISNGHAIVIPKEHIPSEDLIPPEAYELAKNISEKIKKMLQPKTVLIKPNNLFGHEVIDVIPVYTEENPESPRMKVSPEELTKLKKQLDESELKVETERKEQKNTEDKREINEKNTWLPKRIP